jgi:hypothetical protein
MGSGRGSGRRSRRPWITRMEEAAACPRPYRWAWSTAVSSMAVAIRYPSRALAALAVALPIPLLAVAGLSLPLPATVERLAAKLVPFGNAAALDVGRGERPTQGSIVLAPRERQLASRTNVTRAGLEKHGGASAPVLISDFTPRSRGGDGRQQATMSPDHDSSAPVPAVNEETVTTPTSSATATTPTATAAVPSPTTTTTPTTTSAPSPTQPVNTVTTAVNDTVTTATNTVNNTVTTATDTAKNTATTATDTVGGVVGGLPHP